MYVSELPVAHPLIKRLEVKGITELTEIQRETILPALLGKDVIGSSKTGSGKTFAFLIPLIHRLLKNKPLSKQDPRALILAPTRELAKQVFAETKSLTSSMALKTTLIVGGDNYNDQTKQLRKAPHIIVGTVGRIADHLSSKSFFLNGLELLVIDEADRMLDLGFHAELNAVNAAADHRKRQTMLFSATLDSIELNSMTSKLTKAAVRVSVGKASDDHGDITQRCFFADNVEHKDALLSVLLTDEHYDQAIVFCATRDDTQRIAEQLNATGLQAIALHGELLQTQRANIMSAFSRGQYSILVTTDVASRGLDLGKVGLVINYDMPINADEYIHRIGRTGRAGKKGAASSFVGPKDWRSFEQIQQRLDYDLACHAHAALPAKFSGLKPESTQIRQHSVRDKTTQSETKPRHNGPIKRINTMSGTDAGMLPVKKKK